MAVFCPDAPLETLAAAYEAPAGFNNTGGSGVYYCIIRITYLLCIYYVLLQTPLTLMPRPQLLVLLYYTYLYLLFIIRYFLLLNPARA